MSSDFQDTAHSSIIEDHHFVPAEERPWGLCLYEYPNGKVCRLGQAAHAKLPIEDTDPGRPPSMRRYEQALTYVGAEEGPPTVVRTSENAANIADSNGEGAAGAPTRTRDEVIASEGHKDDEGKVSTVFLPHRAKQEVGEVMKYGAKKYAPGNYLKGMSATRLWDAAMRHMDAWVMGEENDPETGKSHLAHAGCCLLMLRELQISGNLVDDRIDPELFL